MLGDFLYALTARDLQVTPLETILTNIGVVNGVDVSFSAEYQVPKGRNLLAYSLQTAASPSGAGLIVYLDCNIATPDKSATYTMFNASTAAANTNQGPVTLIAGAVNAPMAADRQFANLLIPELWWVRATVQFSAAVANQSVRLGVFGLLIPRGNMAL